METGFHPQVQTVDGVQVRYTIAIPETPAPSPPLVLCLHYAGHGAPWYGRPLLTGLIAPALRPLQAVMIAPDCPGRSWTDPRAEALTVQLLAAVQQAHGVDPKRIVVTGYSMGGIGTWHFAAHHPDIFSAAIPIAGRPVQPLPTIPTYIVHSRRDEVIDIARAEAAATQLAAQGVNVVFKPLSAPTHYQVNEHVQGLEDVIPWIQKIWS